MELQKSKLRFDDLNVQILAISTDNPEGPMKMASGNKIEFPLLFTSLDPDVPQNYGVFDLFGDGLASASIFLVGEQGDIVWRSIGKNSSHQISAKEVIDQIQILK